MGAFLHNIFAFPTVVFTVVLSILLIYLLIAVMGLVDHDILHVDSDIHADPNDGMEGLAGLMITFGLSGVPSIIVFVILALVAWLTSYFFVYFFFFWVNPLLNAIVGIGVVALSSAISVFLTAQIIRPLKKLFKKAYATVPQKALIGRTCKVRSSRVTHQSGEAIVNLDGADLIIKVRSSGATIFSRGDILTIAEHAPELEAYMVFKNFE